jgi:hypothetical protein
VDVEREMRRVESDSSLDQEPNATTVETRDRLESSPEQAVMNQHEIRFARAGFQDRCFARIDRGNHTIHGAIVFDLEAVQRPFIIGDVSDTKVGIEVLDEF